MSARDMFRDMGIKAPKNIQVDRSEIRQRKDAEKGTP